MAADNLLRWCLAFAAMLPAAPRTCTFAVVLLYVAMYGGSLFWKDATAYLVDGHPPRSMLLDQYFAAFWPKTLWEPAIALACSPLGPWLGRAVYVGELLASVAALLIVLLETFAPHDHRPALLAASHSAHLAAAAALAPLHLALTLTVYLGIFPWVSLLLHAAASSAAAELSIRRATPLTRIDKAAAVVLVGYFCTIAGMQACGFGDEGRAVTSATALHLQFDLFPYGAGEPLIAGRSLFFAFGQTAGGADFEVDLDQLVPRTYESADHEFRNDATRPVVDPLLWGDIRWRLFSRRVWSEMHNHKERDAISRQMCARAVRLWRAGVLPGKPHLVSTFTVMYDLPREHGAPAVVSEANHQSLVRLTNATGLPLSKLGWSEELGEYGGFPRVVVAKRHVEWLCAEDKLHEDEPLLVCKGASLDCLGKSLSSVVPRGSTSIW
eukprot:g3604.t1